MQSLFAFDDLEATEQGETYGIAHPQDREGLEGAPDVRHAPSTGTDTCPRSELVAEDRHSTGCRVRIDLIDVPPQWRKVRKDGVSQLAGSLAREGLLHPIGVRLDEETGRYSLVFGRHRLEAARNLGWTEIDATLFDRGEEQAYESITDAENLFRSELSPAERVIALKRWNERYMEEHPEAGSPRERGRLGARATNRKLGHGAPEGASEATPPPVKTFVEHVEDVTGMDRKTVERYFYSGKNLSEDELLVLAQNNVPHEYVKRINKLKPDQIAAAISLIAGGCGPKEAIAEATLPPGATLTIVTYPDSARPEEELSDEEWVIQQCDEVLDRLKYKVAYLADAILYRQTREIRAKLRNVAKRPLAQARQKATGPFLLLLSKLVNIDHPANWLPCGACGATGKAGDESECDTCYGNAYLVKRAWQ